MPKMTHPDLDDVVIDVDECRARNRRLSGWVDVDVSPVPDVPVADGSDDSDDD